MSYEVFADVIVRVDMTGLNQLEDRLQNISAKIKPLSNTVLFDASQSKVLEDQAKSLSKMTSLKSQINKLDSLGVSSTQQRFAFQEQLQKLGVTDAQTRQDILQKNVGYLEQNKSIINNAKVQEALLKKKSSDLSSVYKIQDEINKLSSLGVSTDEKKQQLSEKLSAIGIAGTKAQSNAMSELTKQTRRFDMSQLSILFGLGAIAKVFNSFSRNAINSYSSIVKGQTKFGQQLIKAQAAFTFLQFIIADALAPMIGPMIDAFIGFVDFLADNPGITQFLAFAIVVGGLAAAFGAALASLNLLLPALGLNMTLSTSSAASSIGNFLNTPFLGGSTIGNLFGAALVADLLLRINAQGPETKLNVTDYFEAFLAGLLLSGSWEGGVWTVAIAFVIDVGKKTPQEITDFENKISEFSKKGTEGSIGSFFTNFERGITTTIGETSALLSKTANNFRGEGKTLEATFVDFFAGIGDVLTQAGQLIIPAQEKVSKILFYNAFDLVKDLGIFKQTGTQAGTEYAAGITASTTTIQNALGSTLQTAVADQIKGNSPPKTGPLSQGGGSLTWGYNMIFDFATGVFAATPLLIKTITDTFTQAMQVALFIVTQFVNSIIAEVSRAIASIQALQAMKATASVSSGATTVNQSNTFNTGLSGSALNNAVNSALATAGKTVARNK